MKFKMNKKTKSKLQKNPKVNSEKIDEADELLSKDLKLYESVIFDSCLQ